MSHLTISQIRAQVRAIRDKVPDASVVGIQANARLAADAGASDLAISFCESPLAVRLALKSRPGEGVTQVILTPMNDKDLGEEILLRLARRRLHQIDPWQIVRDLFGARWIDPRLGQRRWVADQLLELAQGGQPFPAAPGGFLDEDLAWGELVRRSLGLESRDLDLQALLQWSLDPGAAVLLRGIHDEFLVDLLAWVTRSAGETAAVALKVLRKGQDTNLVATGLALGVLTDPGSQGRLQKALGRFEERYLAGESLPESDQVRWRDASAALLDGGRTDRGTRARIVGRLDEILRDVQADEAAHLSRFSPAGFEQRMERFGQAVVLALDGERPSAEAVDGAGRCLGSIQEHDQAAGQEPRVNQALMALRALRWLALPARPAWRSLAEAARTHLEEGALVDCIRQSLARAEPVESLAQTYSRLFERVTAAREEQSKAFAFLLRDWFAGGSPDSGPRGVESVVAEVIAPIAAERPVLLVVVDGMSAAVLWELLPGLLKDHWTRVTNELVARPIVTALPSVTEVCRTSLLSGRLMRGTSEDEKREFPNIPQLLVHSKPSHPPVLFHKGDLQSSDDLGLPSGIRKEIAARQRRVVGVVLNAVDDHLLKGDQIDFTWSLDRIRVLPALLAAAREADRVVVLTSDHGHVLDQRSTGKAAEGGDRWRIGRQPAGEGEVEITGRRVAIAEHGRLVFPWTERLRYAGKKNGYHGGANIQEVVVPLAVLVPNGVTLDGWREQPLFYPEWWGEGNERFDTAAVVQIQDTIPAPEKLAAPFFGADWNVATSEQRPAPSQDRPEWINRLLASPAYESQKQFAGRQLPSDEKIAEVLAALDRRGGKMMLVALGQAVATSPARLPGMLAIMQRILNVEGYGILNRPDSSNTVELNKLLLMEQFGIGGGRDGS